MKIFVSAYACEPGLGSEIGVGWHWVLEMSRYFELWVLTRESNRHTIEPWIAEHREYEGIHFLYYDWPKWARCWKKGLRGVRTYYNIWQACTNRIVRSTMKREGISIFHHLTYGNALWRVSGYGQRQFFVWGPVGGLETIPREYSDRYDGKSKAIETVRRLAARLARYNVGLRRRCRNADLILCKTEITRQALPLQDPRKAILFTDVATDMQGATSTQTAPKGDTRDRTEFITVGRMDAWRGFDLAIEAIAEAAKSKPGVHLTIVGKGPDRERLEGIVARLGAEHLVTMTGKVTMEEYRRLMEMSDVVVNAALKEGAVTVSFDSMAMGKPLICLDTTGYTRYFNNDYAVLIPRGSRKQVVEEIKRAMVRLTDGQERNALGRKAQEAARAISWRQHGEEIRDAIIKAYNKQP